MNFWISVSSNPAAWGSWISVCYDFSHGASSPVTLRIYRGPTDTDWIEEQVDAENNCVQVYVPPDCTGITIVDRSGQSQDCAVSVTP